MVAVRCLIWKVWQIVEVEQIALLKRHRWARVFRVPKPEEWLDALNDLNAFDDWEIVTDRHHLPFRSPVGGLSAGGPVSDFGCLGLNLINALVAWVGNPARCLNPSQQLTLFHFQEGLC